ncbi:hypothetical protein ACF5W4_15255 [Bacillota bacterium Lsc_1132]
MIFVGLNPKVSLDSLVLFRYLINNGMADKVRKLLTSLCSSKVEVNSGFPEIENVSGHEVESGLGQLIPAVYIIGGGMATLNANSC